MDFEGHGDFKSESDFSISLFRGNVISFIKNKNLTKVDIFGYSMGGYVALDFALHHPSRVKKIITLGTKFSWNPDFARMEIQKLDPKKIQEKVPAFANQLENLHGEENWRMVVSKTADLMQDLGNNPPLQESEFTKIKARTLICLGELDRMSTEEESIKTSQSLQNGNFKSVKNFIHPIEAVPMGELAEIIETFLNQKD
ncbi:alpha/beta fold hydrolase [Aequorivita ciconiae]|uniref:alpha/beta fold hydrolase n=1 Tax=Aequorivita ciconiae TaxID=2494375 RepID=UPI0013E2B44F|nr:alpha/beta hydrolase [Aequorivita sp. H23M31]